MYTVLIADDEKLARFALKKILEDKFDDLQVLGEANSGDEAIALYESLTPDIVFMDIHMPGTNGLDAAAYILRRNPEANIFILTAYDYFDYMQQAIEIGAKGYILKPMEIGQVVEFVEKVKHHLGRKKIKDQQANTMLAQVNDMIPVIEGEFIRALISGETNKKKIEQYITFLKLEISESLFVALRLAENEEGDVETISQKQEDGIKELLSRHLKPAQSFIIGRVAGRSIPILFYTKQDASGFVELVITAIKDVVRKITLKYKMDLVAGVGEVCCEVVLLTKSYNHALLSLSYLEELPVIYYPKISERRQSEGYESDYPFDQERKLVRKIKVSEAKECKQSADDIIGQLFAKEKDLNAIKEYLENFLVTLKKQLIYIRVPLESIQLVADIGELHKINERSQLKTWAYCSIEKIMQQVELVKTDKNINVFRNILAYIDESFASEISLDLVANRIGLSPQYVSKLFKEELGINFINYITEKRVTVAKHLLATTKMRVKEVAIESGYADGNYFCKIFKREVGITPKEYQNKYYNA